MAAAITTCGDGYFAVQADAGFKTSSRVLKSFTRLSQMLMPVPSGHLLQAPCQMRLYPALTMSDND